MKKLSAHRILLNLLLTPVLLLLPVFSCHSQIVAGVDSVSLLAFQQSVKQLGEFIDRFNGEEYTIAGNQPGDRLVLDRRQSILLLFDQNDPRFNRDSPDFSPGYVDLVVGFAEEMTSKEVFLDKHSDQILAIVSAEVIYKGSPEQMNILLEQEVSDPGLVKWVISGVEADFLEIPARDTTRVRFLSPVSHELGFMDLKKAFGEPAHVLEYTTTGFDYDPLHAFLFEVSRQNLVLREITSVSYRISLAPGYNINLEQNLSGTELPSWYILNLKQGGRN